MWCWIIYFLLIRSRFECFWIWKVKNRCRNENVQCFLSRMLWQIDHCMNKTFHCWLSDRQALFGLLNSMWRYNNLGFYKKCCFINFIWQILCLYFQFIWKYNHKQSGGEVIFTIIMRLAWINFQASPMKIELFYY